MEVISMREEISKIQTKNTTEKNKWNYELILWKALKKLTNFYLYLLKREGLNKVRMKEQILQSIASKHKRLIWLAIHQQVLQPRIYE